MSLTTEQPPQHSPVHGSLLPHSAASNANRTLQYYLRDGTVLFVPLEIGRRFAHIATTFNTVMSDSEDIDTALQDLYDECCDDVLLTQLMYDFIHNDYPDLVLSLSYIVLLDTASYATNENPTTNSTTTSPPASTIHSPLHPDADDASDTSDLHSDGYDSTS